MQVVQIGGEGSGGGNLDKIQKKTFFAQENVRTVPTVIIRFFWTTSLIFELILPEPKLIFTFVAKFMSGLGFYLNI